MIIILLILVLLVKYERIVSFRVLNESTGLPANSTYFKPFGRGFVSRTDDATNLLRERVNEGSFQSADQELIYEGPYPRQTCPQMVGPFSDGSYYCTAKEYGYCDRRSGTCFCNTGYEGIDCSNCRNTHYRVGNLCYPKVLCPNDCSGAGVCNFNNGTCNCLPHRVGPSCETMLCSLYDSRCESCNVNECLRCASGYYLTDSLTPNVSVCGSCYDFDPRCAGCTKEDGCTVCADSLLTSIHRSGYRSLDRLLPQEDIFREYSITLPFGTKSPESFAEAESYHVVKSITDAPLNSITKNCTQGFNHTDVWVCDYLPSSHVVCGHPGVFRFTYPNYRVPESYGYLQLTVVRSGGGFGHVEVNYNLFHYTTSDSDVSATAIYTTSQTLVFQDGVIEKSFYVNILQDYETEDDEIFQIYLENPKGGATLGPQFRTNVTIMDDDKYTLSYELTKLSQSSITIIAGDVFSLPIKTIMSSGVPMISSSEYFYAVIENDETVWIDNIQRNSQRHACSVIDQINGEYAINCIGPAEQGMYQFRIWHAVQLGLTGEYYSDAFFQNLELTRIDRLIDFNWGHGRLVKHATDYVSVRWSGVLLPPSSGLYFFYFEANDRARLWIDGDLLLDHWQERDAFNDFPREKYMNKNRFYEIIIDYQEVTGEAYAHLYWGPSPNNMSIIPSEYLFTLAILNEISLTVLSSSTHANKTECYGEGLYKATTLTRSTFSICPRDIYGNLRNDGDIKYLESQNFDASLTFVRNNPFSLQYQGEGSENLVPILQFNYDTFCFDAFYEAERAGVYVLNVLYNNLENSRNYSNHVFGSPFYVSVLPSKMSGPSSDIFGFNIQPLEMEAGSCYEFTLVSRDASRNKILRGGENIELYLYQVYSFSNYVSNPTQLSNEAGLQTFDIPVQLDLNSLVYEYSDDPAIVNGQVIDHNTGNYTLRICPEISGYHYMYVLLNGRGVSNQPINARDLKVSRLQTSGQGSYYGNYVSSSPYATLVINGPPRGLYTTASGPGITSTTVGVETFFILTIRDAYGNIVRVSDNSFSIRVFVNESITVPHEIIDFRNGTLLVLYTPVESLVNSLYVFINIEPISGSPFHVSVADGVESFLYSFARGSGLRIAKSGEIAYFEVVAFDLDGNRKSTDTDVFFFNITGNYNVSGVLKPCSQSLTDFYTCPPYDNYLGLYYGSYIPQKSGISLLRIFSENQGYLTEISNSPFYINVLPGSANVDNTVVQGAIYDNIAGEVGVIEIHLRDTYRNLLQSGGDFVEAFLEDKSTFSKDYAKIVDNYNGKYSAFYNLTVAGEYKLTVNVAHQGLSVYLYDRFFKPGSIDGNYEYYVMKEALFKLSLSDSSSFLSGRREYFSIQFDGFIIPPTSDTYLFCLELDSQSYARVYISETQKDIFPQSSFGRDSLIIDIQTVSKACGFYKFLSKSPHRILIEYSHEINEAFMTLYWESSSVPRSIVPSTSLKYWPTKPLTYNTWIYSNSLKSSASTAAGEGLHSAIAGIESRIQVIARDIYGNQLSNGGSNPSLFIVGANNVISRGHVIDNNNGSYSIDYFPTISGKYRLYITIGCCPAHQSAGLTEELRLASPLLISHAPYQLIISPNQVNGSRSVAKGSALFSGTAGMVQFFFVHFRDLFDNPTHVNALENEISVLVTFTDSRNNKVLPASINATIDFTSATIFYNLSRADDYLMSVFLDINISGKIMSEEIKGSPFMLKISPGAPDPRFTITTGQGLIGGLVNRTNFFDVSVLDSFSNREYVDGFRFYCRLISSNFEISQDIPLPAYDSSQRVYKFTYVANLSGTYNLSLELLNTTLRNERVIGSGLLLSYYSNKYTNDTPTGYEYVKTVDYYSNLLDVSYEGVSTITDRTKVLLSTAIGLMWSGYIIVPFSGMFYFRIESLNMKCSAYIDNFAIDDESESQYFLIKDVGYKLTVTSVPIVQLKPRSVKLLWRSPNSKNWFVIPEIYLVNSGSRVKNSPFLVNIT